MEPAGSGLDGQGRRLGDAHRAGADPVRSPVHSAAAARAGIRVHVSTPGCRAGRHLAIESFMNATKQVRDTAPAVLIFDGDCSVCTSCANWARQHVTGEVEIVPWQRIDLATHDLNADDASAAAWWISPT